MDAPLYTKLIAYHGSEAERAAIIAQLQAHHDADELVKGQYWEDGKGCAVGCTIHGRDHAEYEPRFGIPQMLARLEDCIFEGLPTGTAKQWPIRFMSAVKPGQDLSLVGWRFLHWLLTDEKGNPGIAHPLVKDAVAQAAQVICAIAKGKPLDESAESAARSAARSAERAARNAAMSAARAARSAESAAWSAESAASAARNAARNAAWSAESAESAARSAARSAERAAMSAESAASAASAVYLLMADRLIELIKDAPMAVQIASE